MRSVNETPYTFTLLLVDDPVERITLSYANETERTFDITTNRILPDGALVNATSLSPGVPVEKEISHRDGSPSGGAGLGIPASASDVVYFVTIDGQVVGWDYVTCGDGDVNHLDVTVRDDGVGTNIIWCAL